MDRKIPVFHLLFFVFCAFIATAGTAFASESVRVGYFLTPGIQELNADGTRSGYNYEYMRAIAEVADWELEYVEATLGDCVAMLTSGEIDILGSVHFNENRRRQILFADIPLSMSHSVLRVRRDSHVAYEDFEKFGGALIGVHRDNDNYLELLRYADANEFTARLKFYDSDSNLYNDLQAGNIDMMLCPSMRLSPNSREVARFASRPYYIGVAKDRPDLLMTLNQAQSQLLVNDPSFQSKIAAKYMTIEKEADVVLSEKETHFLDATPRAKAVFKLHDQPLEYGAQASGKMEGAIAEIMNIISQRSGLIFEFVPAPGYTDALVMAYSNEIDVICSFEQDETFETSMGVKSTHPYAHLPMVMVTNSQVKDKRYAIIKEGMTRFWRSRLASDAETVFVSTAEECLDMLVKGEASTTYLNSYTASHFLAKHKYSQLDMVAVPNYTKELRIGVSPGSPPELLSILNKAVSTLSETEVTDMMFDSLINNRPLGLSTVIMRNPLTSILLFAAIVSLIIVGLLANIRYRMKAARKMMDILYVDPLTGGWTMQKFREEAERVLKLRPKAEFALVYFDIKEFKFINDEYGYEEGDRVLKAVAQHLSNKINKGDMATRIMADHFALMIKTPREKAVQRVKDILSGTQAIPQMHQYQLAIGAGIYMRMEEEMNVSIMLDRANYARSMVKKDLFENVMLYNESIRESIRGEKEIEAVMHEALASGCFVPFYQPKVDMTTGRMVGAEALVRWIDPQIGIIPPDRFIPLFEKNGFIVNIDRYIYEQTCKNIGRWLDEFDHVAPMSCNFSRLHIRDKQLHNRLMEIARRYDVAPNFIELEMTESVAMENDEYFVSLTAVLQKSGFRIAIDDFGSGYSSLRLLQKLHADVLKLDKHFADSIMYKTDRVIIEGIVDIAHKLNMEVVCEGIETQEQADFLQSINCRTAQGYFYARPMKLEDFEEFMRQHM